MKPKSTLQRRCGPQRLLHELPTRDWLLDQLSSYAKKQHAVIVAGEQTLAPAYWRLGCALFFARKQFQRGHWGLFLGECGIDKTRSSKACAIYRRFKSLEELKELTVEQAYEARRKDLATTEGAGESTASSAAVNFCKVLGKVDQAADATAQGGSNLNRAQQREVLKHVRAAISRLQILERELAKMLDQEPIEEELTPAAAQDLSKSRSPHQNSKRPAGTCAQGACS